MPCLALCYILERYLHHLLGVHKVGEKPSPSSSSCMSFRNLLRAVCCGLERLVVSGWQSVGKLSATSCLVLSI